MSRKPRIDVIGGVYHVIQRGNNREYIFQIDVYKNYMFELIKEYRDVMQFEIYGFVFMDNHYHIIIKTFSTPLNKIMHRVNTKFSKYYNIRNKRTGHVFENRYKSILVKDDKYLLSLLRYIHQNPVRARMCKSVSNYLWSSDYYYRNNKIDEGVDIDFILDMFSKDRLKALNEYRKFMDEDYMEEEAIFEKSDFLGALEDEDLNIEKERKEDKRISLDDILYEVCKDEMIYKNIKGASRKRMLKKHKCEYIKLALESNYTMDEIGNNIGISAAAVCKLINTEREKGGK